MGEEGGGGGGGWRGGCSYQKFCFDEASAGVDTVQRGIYVHRPFTAGNDETLLQHYCNASLASLLSPSRLYPNPFHNSCSPTPPTVVCWLY